jgi:general secretion pathway protein G
MIWHSKMRLASRSSGFTLLELMVVLLILALLGTVAAPEVIKHLRKAKSETAKIQVDALAAAVDFFNTDVGRYPTQQEGLQALIAAPGAAAPHWDGPYVKKSISLTDPWGEKYVYKIPGDHGAFDIYTLGADKAPGGTGDAADVGNW